MRILLAVDESAASMAAVAYLKGLRFHLPVDLEVVSVLSPAHVGDMTGIGTGMGVGLGTPDIGYGLFSEELKSVENFAGKIAVQFDGKFQSATSAAKAARPVMRSLNWRIRIAPI